MGNWYSHGDSRSGGYSHTFVAPTVPGIQYFQWGLTLDYYCREIGFSQCPQGAFAAICVPGDTDGDGIDDCFDPCPCSAGSSCSYFASTPADETIQCNQQPNGQPTLRNDYCGASRASTGFLEMFSETSTATNACPQSFTRTFTTHNLCDYADTASVVQNVHQISSCDSAVTGSAAGNVVVNAVDDWGYDGAGNHQFRAIVTVTFTNAVNDWRVGVDLLHVGDHVVCYGVYCSVYSGATYSCGTTSPAAFTVKPAGSWAGAVSAGGSVTFEYVATNSGGYTLAQIAAGTNFHIYATASS